MKYNIKFKTKYHKHVFYHNVTIQDDFLLKAIIFVFCFFCLVGQKADYLLCKGFIMSKHESHKCSTHVKYESSIKPKWRTRQKEWDKIWLRGISWEHHIIHDSMWPVINLQIDVLSDAKDYDYPIRKFDWASPMSCLLQLKIMEKNACKGKKKYLAYMIHIPWTFINKVRKKTHLLMRLYANL